jgi:predicted nucleic acid-binding protein
LLRDPGDELVLEAAINGRADALATYNVRDFVVAAPHFGVRVALPAEVLRMTARR